MLGHEGAERGAHILDPAIAVKDPRGQWASATQRLRQHGTRHCSRATMREQPSRVLIHHDGEITPAAAHPEVGDIADHT